MRLEGALLFFFFALLDSHPPSELIVNGVHGVMSVWFDLVSQLLSTSVCVFPAVSHMRESEKKKKQLTPLFALICFCVCSMFDYV